MNIKYHKNPLKTIVELSPEEQEILKLKVKIERLEELLLDAHFHLQEGEYYDIKRAIHVLDPDYYYGKDDDKGPCDLDTYVERMTKSLLQELQGSHDGDCTCQPCSCMKCHAEDLLKIDTTPNISKYWSYKIDGAFGKDGEKTSDEALESLQNYDPKPTSSWIGHEKDFMSYVPRWKEEARQAYEWLLNYYQEHPEAKQ